MATSSAKVIPENVTICGYPYSVNKVESIPVNGGELCGEIDYFKLSMQIATGQPPLHERATVMHEILHGIANHTGQIKLRKSEAYMDALAYSLVTLLRANPDLVAYLTD